MRMRSLGVLCARGASKRLPRKHLQPLAGLPLVAWMCRAVAASTLTRSVMTTEDEAIARVAADNGVDVLFRRSAPLAEDFAADYDIVVDALDWVERAEGARYDIVVMLQPTTPFVQPADIEGCVRRLADNPALAMCFTARPVSEPPQWMFVEAANGEAAPLLDATWSNDVAHKQLLARCWLPTGAAYAIRAEAFRAQKKIYCTPHAFHPMDRDRAIDIDEKTDLIVANAVAQAHGLQPWPPTRSGIWSWGVTP